MKANDQGAVHMEAGEGKPLRVFGEEVTRKVASEQTGGAYSLFEAAVKPQRGVPPHIHHREDECFYILEGEFVFMIEGRAVRANPGSLIYVSKGTLHTYENVGESVGRMLVCQTPGGLCEGFYEEVGEVTSNLAPSSEASSEAARIAKTAARYGIEIAVHSTSRALDGRDAKETNNVNRPDEPTARNA